jgi:prophage DNA circulation protein
MGAVSTIRDLVVVSPWRARLLPAYFANMLFHVEAGSQEGGRRIVTHEFPKKELPYSEDMGRKATEFTVRGYIIQYPYDTGNVLYQRDYTVARDLLQTRLDTSGSGTLQLPTTRPMTVVCSRYRMTEEEKLGGYVVFDMTFVELGAPPFRAGPTSQNDLLAQSQAFRSQVLDAIMIARVSPAGPQRARVNPKVTG